MLTLENLARIHSEFGHLAERPVREFSLGKTTFAFNSRPYLMGVINLSPDSWYRESVCLSADHAIARGHTLLAQGAHILDLGAESTLGHAVRVDGAAQSARLLPVIKELASAGALISVETYDHVVLSEAFAAGACVLNLTGSSASEEMFRIVAETQGAVIICYVEGANVREVGDFNLTGDPLVRMHDYFARQIERAIQCGVEKIVIDPGMGFYYKNLQDSSLRVQHQIQTFLQSLRFRDLGFPICHALPHAFEYFREEVRSAEAFFAVMAALGKTNLFRTHEVPRVKPVLETMQAFAPPPAA